ncbi:hypothetical protein GCM10023238_32570 [Streptomyces heliomycini]
MARRAQRLDDLARRLREGTGPRWRPSWPTCPIPATWQGGAAGAGGRRLGFSSQRGDQRYGPFAGLEPELMTKILDVNVLAVTALTRAASRPCWNAGAAPWSRASQLAFAGALPPGPLPERAVYGGTRATWSPSPHARRRTVPAQPLRIQVLCPD